MSFHLEVGPSAFLGKGEKIFETKVSASVSLHCINKHLVTSCLSCIRPFSNVFRMEFYVQQGRETVAWDLNDSSTARTGAVSAAELEKDIEWPGKQVVLALMLHLTLLESYNLP